ncbi:MAG TPA: hypothetical protein DCE44_07210 [Verrucomicrobiales bacterium]|nr:hypothetical protein [Verrucomicrobiales bacterium]
MLPSFRSAIVPHSFALGKCLANVGIVDGPGSLDVQSVFFGHLAGTIKLNRADRHGYRPGVVGRR